MLVSYNSSCACRGRWFGVPDGSVPRKATDEVVLRSECLFVWRKELKVSLIIDGHRVALSKKTKIRKEASFSKPVEPTSRIPDVTVTRRMTHSPSRLKYVLWRQQQHKYIPPYCLKKKTYKNNSRVITTTHDFEYHNAHDITVPSMR